MTQQNDSIGKGIAAGMLGGLISALAMNQFRALLSKLDSQGARQSGGEPATVKAAEALSEEVLHKAIPQDNKETAGGVMHYAMGAASGGIYGALAEMDSNVSIGGGVLFGTALWLVADELAVPARATSNPSPLTWSMDWPRTFRAAASKKLL